MKHATLLAVFLLLPFAWQSALAAAWELPAGIKTLQVNGYPIAYVERGSGETVVLVHGVPYDYRAWHVQIASPPPGVRVIAVSLRHSYPEPWDGKSDTYTAKQHAEDIAAFIEALGVGPVSLVGHSRGGIFAMRTALARPDLVKKLILVEAAFNSLLPATDSGRLNVNALLKSVRAQYAQGDIEGGLQLWVDGFDGKPGTWQAKAEEARQHARANAWTLLPHRDGAASAIRCDDFAVLKMPVMLLEGADTDPRFTRIVDATYNCAPSAQRVIISKADHFPQTTNPAGFAKALVEFLLK